MVSSFSLLILLLIGCSLHPSTDAQSVPMETRHSFSLTTFDINGKLDQVERALLAASLGTPIVGLVILGKNNVEDRIILASPQILPSPLMRDDGTSRFARVSPQIVLGHAGIAADGRIVVEAAQRLAVEHSYTYDEPIPIGIFLEEISLLFQSYTTKPGVRPFGCTLLVAYLPPLMTSDSGTSKQPRLFRVDCSGAVEELLTVATINGRSLGSGMKSKLSDLSRNSNEFGTRREERQRISYILEEAMKEVGSKNKPFKDGSEDGVKFKLPLRIVSASFDRDQGLVVERRLPEIVDGDLVKSK